MIKWGKIFDKYKLRLMINKKFRNIFHSSHVLAVMTILVHEIRKDILDGKKIRIKNFGTIYLKNNKPRPYFDVSDRQFKVSGDNNKKIKFVMDKHFKSKLRALVNLDKLYKIF